jgi:uncharacterized protein (DUF362 family)/ferredoxin
MNKTKVSVVSCPEYEYPRLYAALEKALGFIGGLSDLIKQGKRVLVKINHLPPASPAEKGIVTHPVFVEAVLSLLKETGAQITLGDDIESGAEDGYLISGFRQMSERVGVELINLREAGFIEVECHGSLLEKVCVSRACLEADVIVNLPKFKAHALTVFTGCIKNMYGVIPAGLRTRFHGEYPKLEDFCQVIVDIFATVKPQLNIMDGIVAMEGEGPACGDLKKLGVILAGWDAVAVDTVATKIIGLEPTAVATTRFAGEWGLGVGDLKSIEILGEKFEDIMVSDFRLPTGTSAAIVERMPEFLSRFVLERCSVRPRVDSDRCTGCLECKNACPRAAITEDNGGVAINRAECIGCLCCLEVCRYGAVTPERSLVGSTLERALRMWHRVMAAVR